jgi:hypothetical protein
MWWPMRLDAVWLRVSIGCVFIWIVTELETIYIYKAVLQTIKVVDQTPTRVSELLARNHILIKKYWTYGCYSPEGPNQDKTHRVPASRLILYRHVSLILPKISDDDTSIIFDNMHSSNSWPTCVWHCIRCKYLMPCTWISRYILSLSLIKGLFLDSVDCVCSFLWLLLCEFN